MGESLIIPTGLLLTIVVMVRSISSLLETGVSLSFSITLQQPSLLGLSSYFRLDHHYDCPQRPGGDNV